MITRAFITLSLLLLSGSLTAFGQGQPIGSWRAHMPFGLVLNVATDGTTLYAIGKYSFYTYNASNSEITPYSKVEGMADVGMAYVAYDATTDYIILAYSNGNIDLFKDETFFNIPDIKLKTLSGLKAINHIYTEDGLAYLSTSFGIVVLNLSKKEIKETYSFVSNSQTVEVKGFVAFGNYFYAATSAGLYRAKRNSPTIQAFSSWEQVDKNLTVESMATFSNELFVATPDSLFKLVADTLSMVYESPYQILQIDSSSKGLLVNEDVIKNFTGRVKVMEKTGQISDSFITRGRPAQTVELDDKSLWVADAYYGLSRRNSGDDLSFFNPEGPSDVGSFDILPYNGDVWVAHGGYDENWTYIYNEGGISNFKDGRWKTYNRRSVPVFNQGVTDFIVLARDPIDGTIYAGSYRSGLFIFHPDGSQTLMREGTVLETGLDPTSYRVAGLTFDQDGHLWVNQAGSINEIIVKTRDGQWYKYRGGGSSVYSAYVLTDDYNQKWYILPGIGMAVYNDNHSPANGNDDVFARLSTSIVSSGVNCIAKDRQGSIWFGTNDGIGIFNCSPDQVASGTCQAERPIVQYDQFAGYLFQNEKVKTIAVDGANRKWIGTTNGVWLISPDGDQIINRFNSENSPLPSNNIQKISVDPVTGDVYIGTALGLVSYRGMSTDGGETNQKVTTFPNPVPSGFSGTIAIRGLSENSDVRITDMSGQLVYRTRALGGQAVWNGKDYTGRRPQSGVYLIFATNKDGTQTHSGKMVFME